MHDQCTLCIYANWPSLVSKSVLCWSTAQVQVGTKFPRALRMLLNTTHHSKLQTLQRLSNFSPYTVQITITVG